MSPHSKASDGQGRLSKELTKAIAAGKDEVLAALAESEASILAEVQREFNPTHDDIKDQVLRDVVKKIEQRTRELVMQATHESHVDLTLDDLFDVVTELIPKANTIKAIDIEIDRWATDERASTYADKNRLALESGAVIKRVYVISPDVTVQMMDAIEKTLIHHLEFNENPAVERANGRMSIGVLHHEDMSDPKPPRDFAIFDDTGVLFELFKTDWTSTFRGQLTKNKDVRKEHSAYFDRMWKKSKRLHSANDVRLWAREMRSRLISGEFKTDVFVGYAAAAADTAEKVIKFIERHQYSVRDWQSDFYHGANLLAEIEAARNECRLGLFLFTGDDVPDEGDPTPRDNVILEYGYFLGSKQEREAIVILEEGTKKPTDVDGTLDLRISDLNDLSSISDGLLDWLEEHLGARQRKKRR